MSWLSKLLGKKPPVQPPVPIPPALYTARVEVFDGDILQDEKVVGATVGLDVPLSVVGSIVQTDGAGNAHFHDLHAGRYPLTITAPGFKLALTSIIVPGGPKLVSLERDVPALVQLTTDRQIFKQAGAPWRWKGVTAFKLLDRFAKGEDINPFLDAYRGFNVLRVFGYAPVKDWGVSAWDWPELAESVPMFLSHCADRGWYVELVLLTDDDPTRIPQAHLLVTYLGALPIPNLLVEAANEPITHKDVNTRALKAALETSGFLYSSGDYEDSDRWFGTYYTCHTARTKDWTRRAHDLYDFYTGEGPDKKTHPHHVPCIADEPGKLQDVGANVAEWRAYFGACSLLGGGATFHSESGKLANLPTDAEKPLIVAALDAMDAFPADAPYGPYRRIAEPGNEPGGPTQDSRTYVVGSYAVRCQQAGSTFPEPGWTPIDTSGVLWRR